MYVGADSPWALSWMITSVGADFTVDGPPELIEEIRKLGQRIADATPWPRNNPWLEPCRPLYSSRVSTWSRSYGEFVQACRAYRPSELVPALARISAAFGEPPYSDRDKFERPPWGLATAARESLLYGNENRNKAVSDRAIDDLMRRFFHAEALPNLRPGDTGFLLSLLTPVMYEQFPWQESIFKRSHDRTR